MIEKMKNNPQGWKIEDLKAIAQRNKITWRQNGTSHVVFITKDGRTLPVPCDRPIKAVYVKKFIALLED